MSTSCPACGHENRRGLKLCIQCGGSVAVVCPVCGVRAEQAGRFCGHCGAALTPAAPPGPRPSPSRARRNTSLSSPPTWPAPWTCTSSWMPISRRRSWAGSCPSWPRRCGGSGGRWTSSRGRDHGAVRGPGSREDHARRAAWHPTRRSGVGCLSRARCPEADSTRRVIVCRSFDTKVPRSPVGVLEKPQVVPPA